MDLTVPLKCEELDQASWNADKARRAGEVAGRQPKDYKEKNLFRQFSGNNKARDVLEEVIREINKIVVVATADANGVLNFNAANKTEIVKKLRKGLNDNYEHKLFCKLALKYGYEAAEEIVDDDDDGVSESLLKKVLKISEKYDKRLKEKRDEGGKKSGNLYQPYGRGYRQRPVQANAPMQMFVQPVPQQMQPVSSMHYQPMQFQSYPNAQPNQGMYQQKVSYKPNWRPNNRGRGGFKPPDKSTSPCHACGLIGKIIYFF